MHYHSIKNDRHDRWNSGHFDYGAYPPRQYMNGLPVDGPRYGKGNKPVRKDGPSVIATNGAETYILSKSRQCPIRNRGTYHAVVIAANGKVKITRERNEIL